MREPSRRSGCESILALSSGRSGLIRLGGKIIQANLGLCFTGPFQPRCYVLETPQLHRRCKRTGTDTSSSPASVRNLRQYTDGWITGLLGRRKILCRIGLGKKKSFDQEFLIFLTICPCPFGAGLLPSEFAGFFPL